MKLGKLIIFLLSLIVLTNSRSHRSHRTGSTMKTTFMTGLKTTRWVTPLIKTAASYHSFANLAYCRPDIINMLACPLCESILDASFKVYKLHQRQYQGYEFTYVILYSQNRNEVVITFSGPKSADPLFYSTIYGTGFGKFHGVGVEKLYLEVYKGEFMEHLHADVAEYITSLGGKDPAASRFVLVGHSFGGSLATLAAFDLLSNKIIAKNDELISPIVYSYGQLRIGDNAFVEASNEMFKVIRIVKNNDYYSRMPNCVWSPGLKKFRCFRDHQNLMLRYPDFRRYIMNYYSKGANPGRGVGLETAYGGERAAFLEKSTKMSKKRGFYYSPNNPGILVNGYGNNFDWTGNSVAYGFSYSQPLGAEVLFSNRFSKYAVCSYFYGIPTCEKQLPNNFNAGVNRRYFNHDLDVC